MMIPQSLPLIFLLPSAFGPVSALWPAPQVFTKGSSAVFLKQGVEITYNGGPLAYTAGTYPTQRHRRVDSREFVQAAVSRLLSSIFADEFVPWEVQKRGQLAGFEPDASRARIWLRSLELVQTAEDEAATFKPLAGQVDEAYNLTVSEDGKACMTAVSSIGLLRALETFGQLFYQHSEGAAWYTPYAPIEIHDHPSFPHRGLMLDTSRHFFHVSDILRTVDAMVMSKMNRLHIHVTDSQSWPLEITALPELSEKGAYGPAAVYTVQDVEHIQTYAMERGVEVIFEIDMPGHSGSISYSHPELVVAWDFRPYEQHCAQPPCGSLKLDDTAVEAFLDKLMADFLPHLSPFSAYFHTGGDEYKANNSMLDPHVASNQSDVVQPLVQAFTDRQHKRVRDAGLTPMTWEEIPLSWNVTLGEDVVVQSWLGRESVKKLTGKRLKVIDSDYNYWYLDCGRGQWLSSDNGAAFRKSYPFTDWCQPYKSWQLMYSHDPIAGLTPEEARFVLGGEVAVWSETIDAANLDSLLWPRASAAGEVLWSGHVDAAGRNRSQVEAAPRLDELRARMLARGIGASPIWQQYCSQAGDLSACELTV